MRSTFISAYIILCTINQSYTADGTASLEVLRSCNTQQELAPCDLAADISALVAKTKSAFTEPLEANAASIFEHLREAWSRVLVVRSLDFASYKTTLEKNFSAQGLNLPPDAPVWKLFDCEDVGDVTTHTVQAKGSELITFLDALKENPNPTVDEQSKLQKLHTALFPQAPLALCDTAVLQHTATLLLTAVRQALYVMRESLSLNSYQHFHQGPEAFKKLIKQYNSTLNTLHISDETVSQVIMLCCMLKVQKPDQELLEELLLKAPFNDPALNQVNGDNSWKTWAQSLWKSVVGSSSKSNPSSDGTESD